MKELEFEKVSLNVWQSYLLVLEALTPAPPVEALWRRCLQLVVAILAFSLHIYRLGPSTALPVVIVWVSFPFSVSTELLLFMYESNLFQCSAARIV